MVLLIHTRIDAISEHAPAKNDAFMTSALKYVEETLVCAEIVRLVPRFIAP